MGYFLKHVMAHSIYFITDPCQIKNGGCHANATCRVDGNQVTCRCMPGYIGDGYDCKSTCKLYNGGCHFLASCYVHAKVTTL